MNIRIFVLAITVVALAGPLRADEAKPKVAKAPKASVQIAADAIKWEDFSAKAPDVKKATLWGNMEKGAFGALAKFPAGHKSPLHTHTSDLRLLIVSGPFRTARREARRRPMARARMFSFPAASSTPTPARRSACCSSTRPASSTTSRWSPRPRRNSRVPEMPARLTCLRT